MGTDFDILADDLTGAETQALLRLLGDPELWAQLSAEGRDYASEWSDDKLAGRMAELYRQIVASHCRALAHDLNLNPR